MKSANSKEPRVGSRSPWGDIDCVDVLAPGVLFCGTPGHGGVWVAPELRKRLPAEFRKKAWFEEDCEWGIPETIFAKEILAYSGKDRRAQAEATWKNWYPDSYESYFGVSVPVEESYVKGERKFLEETRDKFVVRSACGSWAEGVPEGKVGVIAIRKSDGATGYWLVDAESYRARSDKYGCVIDTTVDSKTTELSFVSKKVA